MPEAVLNGKRVSFEPEMTILEAAARAGITIPTLCYHPALETFGGCRICLVEAKGFSKLLPACTTPILNRVPQTGQRYKSSQGYQ
ncbi:MAG: 2Fe-2S iron-sulfur cluster-binding protein, partial [Cloacibacillus porcorum]|nr:2Fe-2S iron-sulfur cluster-binding protein [Cloacibacillus porcorum]